MIIKGFNIYNIDDNDNNDDNSNKNKFTQNSSFSLLWLQIISIPF